MNSGQGDVDRASTREELRGEDVDALVLSTDEDTTGIATDDPHREAGGSQRIGRLLQGEAGQWHDGNHVGTLGEGNADRCTTLEGSPALVLPLRT